MLILAVILPFVLGAVYPMLPLKNQRMKGLYLVGAALLTSVIVWFNILSMPEGTQTLFAINPILTVSFKLDRLGRVFAGLVSFLWPIATLYALEYMKDDERPTAFFAFYTMSYGVTLGIASSANLLTLFVFYELLTLVTLPLVIHGGSAQSVSAGLKYLYYSLGGAALAFVGLVYVIYYTQSAAFVYGGLFDGYLSSPEIGNIRFGYFLCFLGFGVKSAVFPMHAWLPSAAVAPTPVTALLHAVAVVKAGTFAVIRLTFYSFGTAILIGSWVQYVVLGLSIFTIVYGSVMAIRERHLKRRLAYSTVSNLSYILFGVLLMTPEGLAAGLMHLIFHALMKISLFYAAGIYMQRTGRVNIQDMRGIGRRMPLTSAVFMLGSLAMTGIPPLIGFLSKWALGSAAVLRGGFLSFAGVVSLIAAAIMSAVYLLIPASTAYFSKPDDNQATGSLEPGWQMKTTLVTLAVAVLVLSFFPQPLVGYLTATALGAP